MYIQLCVEFYISRISDSTAEHHVHLVVALSVSNMEVVSLEHISYKILRSSSSEQ
jgi:hypothetical protein